MQIGRRIYFESATGNIIVDTGEREGSVMPSTIEQDISAYKALSERNRDTFDILEIPYGSYRQDFAESNRYRVNPETKELEFSYSDPNQPDEPQPYQKSLTEQIQEIRLENAQANAEMFEVILQLQMGGM